MFDIFGQPNWTGLAGGILGDLLRGLLETLDLFLLVMPLWLAGSIAGHLKSKKVSIWIIAPVAALVFLLPFACYYFAYPYIEFPYWMRWIHR